MIVIRQKEFNSKAQKARRAKWDMEGYKSPVDKELIEYQKNRGRLNRRTPEEIKLDEELGVKVKEAPLKTDKQAEEAARKKLGRGVRQMEHHGDPLKNPFNKSKSSRRLRLTFGNHPDRPNTELYKKEALQDHWKGVSDRFDAAEKKKKLVEKADEYEKKEAERKAKKAADSRASIAKHEAKAAELRAKKVAGQKLVKNLKTAGKVGIGVAGAAGIGYGIKKAVDKNKKENGKEK